MADDGSLALFEINQAPAMFPLRLAHFGQLLPNRAQMFQDQVFDFLVHVSSITNLCSIWFGQDAESLAPVDAVRLEIVVVDGIDAGQ